MRHARTARIALPFVALALLACLPLAAATITVTSTADSGAGTLRQAILDSNTSAGVLDTTSRARGPSPSTGSSSSRPR